MLSVPLPTVPLGYGTRTLLATWITLGHHVMKKAYLEKKRQTGSETVSTLSPQKRGRPVLLGQHVNKQVHLYLSNIYTIPTRAV